MPNVKNGITDGVDHHLKWRRLLHDAQSNDFHFLSALLGWDSPLMIPWHADKTYDLCAQSGLSPEHPFMRHLKSMDDSSIFVQMDLNAPNSLGLRDDLLKSALPVNKLREQAFSSGLYESVVEYPRWLGRTRVPWAIAVAAMTLGAIWAGFSFGWSLLLSIVGGASLLRSAVRYYMASALASARSAPTRWVSHQHPLGRAHVVFSILRGIWKIVRLKHVDIMVFTMGGEIDGAQIRRRIRLAKWGVWKTPAWRFHGNAVCDKGVRVGAFRAPDDRIAKRMFVPTYGGFVFRPEGRYVLIVRNASLDAARNARGWRSYLCEPTDLVYDPAYEKDMGLIGDRAVRGEKGVWTVRVDIIREIDLGSEARLSVPSVQD